MNRQRFFQRFQPLGLGRYSLALLVLWTLSACGLFKPKPPKPSHKVLPPMSSEALIEASRAQRLDFEWLSAKVKVDFEDKEQSVGATMQIRIRKDSLIWLTVKKLGVEGLRAQIHPKYIETLNHQDKQYQRRSLRFLAEQVDLPLGFAEIQDFFVGNAVLIPSTKPYLCKIEGDCYRLEKPGLNDYIGMLIQGEHFLLKQIARDQGRNSADIYFEDHKPLGNILAPYTRRIEIEGPDLGQLKLEFRFSDIELNQPQKMKFEIPDDYQRLEE